MRESGRAGEREIGAISGRVGTAPEELLRLEETKVTAMSKLENSIV